MTPKRIRELAEAWAIPTSEILAQLEKISSTGKTAQSILTEEEMERLSVQLGLGPTPPPASPTVLVVDDDPDMIDLLTRFLSRRGLTVVSASSGEQGLEKVQQGPIDVIVLDVMMPGMDGLEVCAALKTMPSAPALPIILLTARDDVKTRLEAARLGVSEFLVKPASGNELLARIQTHLEVHRKARETERALRKTDGD